MARIIFASEGMYLTRKNRGENDEPIMSTKVINPQEEWVEISIEDGDAIVAKWQAEQQIKMQQEINA